MNESGQIGEKKIKDGFGQKVFVIKPSCPFCGLPIKRPQELDTHRPTEMPLGSCACGAVYACDTSGHNLGVAFNEALVFACNMDWDLAWGLLPEDDYLTQIVEGYDLETHLVVPGGVIDGRHAKGALYFIRMHDDIQEVTQEGVEQKLTKATLSQPGQAEGIPAGSLADTPVVTLSKSEVEEIIKSYENTDLLMKAAVHDKKIIRKLQRMLYTPDELIRLRTAELLGKVSVIVARKNPNAVSQVLKGMLSSVFDSAASSWGAIDAAGEIVANLPSAYAGYLPALYRLLSDEEHQAATLRALINIAKGRQNLISIPPTRFINYLYGNTNETKGYAVILAGILKIAQLRNELEQLVDNNNEMLIYEKGNFTKTTIGKLAAEALENMDTEPA